MLCEMLQQINAECHDDYGHTAGGYPAQMEKFSTYLGLKMSRLIFAGTEQLSITLHRKDTTVQEATTTADLTMHYLEQQRSDEGFHSFYQDVLKSSKDVTALSVFRGIGVHQRDWMRRTQLGMNSLPLKGTSGSGVLKC